MKDEKKKRGEGEDGQERGGEAEEEGQRWKREEGKGNIRGSDNI